MKKYFSVFCVLLCIFLYGCGYGGGQTEEIAGQNSALEIEEDLAEVQMESGDSYVLLPDQYEIDWVPTDRDNCFPIDSDNILNYEEALAEMVVTRLVEQRERKAVSFCDTFPIELQEAYQYEIEHCWEVGVHFGEYNTGLEWHAIEKLPYEIPSELLWGSNVMYAEGRDYNYQEIDLDGDGVMEYLFREERPMALDFRMGFVYKLVDGELVLCLSQCLHELGMESLYYEGDYYLYMGNLLIRCGEGCDLLACRYDEEEMNRATYIPEQYSIENSYLDYIVAVVEKGDYTWHEGYRSEGYEGIDFQSYLPDGLENQLPRRGVRGQYWFFERTDTSAGGSFQECCHYLPVEVEGRECIYLFLPKMWGSVTADVIVAVLVPESDEKYTIACMYSLNHANEYFLIDKSQYTDDLVTNDYIAYYCWGDNPRVQNDSYDEMIEQYQPNRRISTYSYCHSSEGYPLLVLPYGEGKTAVAVVQNEEFKIIYDDNGNTESRFIEPCYILEHELDQETGTESYLHYVICSDDYTDDYNVKIVLQESFVRVDEDRDGLFTEADSYYYNEYGLDQHTWERWQYFYRNYSGD